MEIIDFIDLEELQKMQDTFSLATGMAAITVDLKGNFITFGLNKADYIAKNIEYSSDGTKFDIFYKDEFLISIQIQLTGKHNIYNTLAVVSALKEAGVELNKIEKYFYDFTGMGRRFQKITELNGIQVFDDYAHHPTEIKATLEAASIKFGKENIVAVFQPHRYTRLQGLCCVRRRNRWYK